MTASANIATRAASLTILDPPLEAPGRPPPCVNTYNPRRRFAVLASLILAVSACGGSSSAKSHYTEQQITEALRAYNVVPAEESNGTEPCVASVILNTRAEVDTYTGAGDTIATSKDGTAGVKVTSVAGSEGACLGAAQQALDSLPG